MRSLSKTALLAAGAHLALTGSLTSFTSPAYAQAPAPVQPAQPVQPVPYDNPVPYGQPAAPPATAQPSNAGADVIYLKNGGILRGTLIDAIPGSQARLQLATGEIATVPWTQIDRIGRAGEAPSPAAPAPAPAAPAPPPPATGPSTPSGPALGGPSVWVHIDGSEEARLEQDVTGYRDWRLVCRAPCDMQVPTGKDYRITGDGLRPSGPFALQGREGDRETVEVNGASKGWFVFGVVLGGAGVVGAGIGLYVALIGAVVSSADSTATSYGNTPATTSDRKTGEDAEKVGFTIAAAGAAAGVAGLVLIIANFRTGVSQDVAAGKAAQNDSWTKLPVPTWRTATPEQRALPPSVGFPLVSGTF